MLIATTLLREDTSMGINPIRNFEGTYLTAPVLILQVNTVKGVPQCLGVF